MNGLIKICGVSKTVAIDAAKASMATHIGFMFVPTSRRYIAPENAAAMARFKGPNLKSVAVIQNISDDELERILQIFRPDYFQLHGSEDPQRVSHLSSKFGVGIIKAIGVETSADLVVVRSFQTCADMLLLDAKPPKTGAGSPAGGHGRAFDWGILRGVSFKKPWFLSGGLNVSNVEQGILSTACNGVDVSTGVERDNGDKDALLISQLCEKSHSTFRSRIPE